MESKQMTLRSQTVKCPHCGEVFQVDEAGYAAIVKQVRDKEFNREIDRRETAAVELAKARYALAEARYTCLLRMEILKNLGY